MGWRYEGGFEAGGQSIPPHISSISLLTNIGKRRIRQERMEWSSDRLTAYAPALEDSLLNRFATWEALNRHPLIVKDRNKFHSL